MRAMGLEAIYRKSNTSKPAPEHRIYPYLLKGVAVDRVNQVWAADITYLPMSRGFLYLVAIMDWQPVRAGLEALQYHLVQEVLDGHRSASTTTEAEDYGRKDTTGISGNGGYERKERSQVAERSVAVGEEEAQLANAPGCVLGGGWDEEIVPLLRRDAREKLQATVLLEWLDERYPGRFNASHLRTLRRRLRDWRALNGPDREVYFEQEHPPGREAQMDFTHCDSLEVTIGGEPFEHMLFEFILSHSGWRYAQVCFSETFAALVSGLQGALWELGAVPEVVRSDNLGAATHDLKDSRGRDFNERYKAILDHYGLKATRTNSYSAHENGVAEQGHRRLKDAVAQALVLRGSSDFESVEQYAKFVRSIVDKRNRLVREKAASEYPHLRALPPAPVPEYVSYSSRVRKWSTIRVDSRTYSVPSRLIGVMVDVWLYTDHVEVLHVNCDDTLRAIRDWI